MAYPPEFDYANEADFTDRLVVPLLNRLGYSLVVNFHGANEQGKDLIVADVGRFSHVRYHGIQVKYVPSISNTAASDLIKDGEQAFITEFCHPQTGQKERISTFYVITGGTISDPAKELFFQGLRPRYGDNAKIIDGKGLLQLDRVAVAQGLESVRTKLQGILLESQKNVITASLLTSSFEAIQKGDDGAAMPMQRFRLESTGRFLDSPGGPLLKSYDVLFAYWDLCRMVNKIMDTVDIPITSTPYRESRIEATLRELPRVQSESVAVNRLAAFALKQLGPLINL